MNSVWTHALKNKREDTFKTAATVPDGFEESGTWNTALCLFGSKCSLIGSYFSTPNFLSTWK